MGKCQHCDRSLFTQTASIPESINCYKSGTEDPEKPGNQIVREWVCPRHGVQVSPGGGVCGIYEFKGGPLDGKMMCVSPGFFVREVETEKFVELHLYTAKYPDNRPLMEYDGVMLSTAKEELKPVEGLAYRI